MKMLTALKLLACAISVQCVWVAEMENPGLYEGDIMLDPDEWPNKTHHYASIIGGRWPGAKVPYVITDSIGPQGVRAIENAIRDYHKYTCIRFHKRTYEDTYLSFYRGGGCSSYVGYRRGRVNHVSLAAGCWYTGTTIHEIGHSLGFHHEQNRPDRDNYVEIMWDNIGQGMSSQFYKMPKDQIDSLGTPYDLESTMHYGEYAFSGNRRPTIRTKDPSKQHWIQDNRRLSKIDKIQLNLMYCKGYTTPKPVCDNKDEYCDHWAKEGYCKSDAYGEWMKAHCCLACGGGGGLPTPKPDCVNEDDWCEYWAQHGYCKGDEYGPWMHDHCCLACREASK